MEDWKLVFYTGVDRDWIHSTNTNELFFIFKYDMSKKIKIFSTKIVLHKVELVASSQVHDQIRSGIINRVRVVTGIFRPRVKKRTHRNSNTPGHKQRQE